MSADSDTPPGRCPQCGGPVAEAHQMPYGPVMYACLGPCLSARGGPALFDEFELEPAPAGRISAHARKQIAAAEQACADGRGGCLGEGCVPGHRAADVLAAYDDLARAKPYAREASQPIKPAFDILCEQVDIILGRHSAAADAMHEAAKANPVTVVLSVEQEYLGAEDALEPPDVVEIAAAEVAHALGVDEATADEFLRVLLCCRDDAGPS